jgi:hypothetical protein
MKLNIFFAIFIISINYTNAQVVFLNGIITDSLSQEKLSSANIKIQQELENGTGISSNQYGYYGYKTTVGTHKFIVSHVGYNTKIVSVEIKKDTTIDFQLTSVVKQLKEVEVKSENQYYNPRTESYQIPLSLIRQAPALLGESDALKIIQTLPGVQAGAEGTAGLNVRGGSPDQNLVLLDGLPVYNVFHLFGFYSVFNTSALKSVDFFKSNIPARYGGRLSSVIDITMKEGNMVQPKYSFNLSPIAGNFSAEGPIKKGKISYIVSARRTWVDLLTNIFFKSTGQTLTGYNFDDINAKINFKISSGSHLYISSYRGRDRFNSIFKEGDDFSRFQFNWGNYTSTIRYTKIFSNKLFGTFQIGHLNYVFNINNQYKNQYVNYYNRVASKISDLTIKSDFDLIPSNNHRIRFGTIITKHKFEPNIRQYRGDNLIIDTDNSSSEIINSFEGGMYAEDEWKLSNHLTANLGIHQSMNLSQRRWYVNPQPRASIIYAYKENNSLKLSYNYLAQYLHLLTNTSLGLPTDLWVPVTNLIPPQVGQQVSFGYNKAISNSLKFSLEGYYKLMNNVLEYKEGSTFLNDYNSRWYDRVVVGKGRSYGLETFIQKTSGKWTGWLSYTLSKTERRFLELNSGDWFDYKYDRRHNLNTIITYELSPRRQITGNFVFTSGNPATIATSVYQGISPPNLLDNYLNPEFYSYHRNLEDLSQRNNFRLPSYHRFDLSFKTTKYKKNGTRSWVFSCYNVYNRKNSFFVFYQNGNLKQFTLFTIIPAVNYHYEF